MQALSVFHDFTLLILLLILRFVRVLMGGIVCNRFINKRLRSHHALELVWTFLPVLILIGIILPSLTLLFMLDDGRESRVTYKIKGRQWNWTYAIGVNGESVLRPMRFITREVFASHRFFRMLDTNVPLFLLGGVKSQLLVTSEDVLHAWTVPTFGVKADACPGRLNELRVIPRRRGEFFGQCSEICGAYHSWIPIQVVVWGNTVL